jgi:hypothetical protein
MREMCEKAWKWLHGPWWGLVVAHFIILCLTYLLIWQFAEPLGIPDTIDNLPAFVKLRAFFHVTLTLLIGAYITLILELVIRKKKANPEPNPLNGPGPNPPNVKDANRINIRFDCANDFSDGAATVAYSLTRTRNTPSDSVLFGVSSEAAEIAEREIRNLDELPKLTPKQRDERLHLLKVRDNTNARLETFTQALHLALDDEGLRNIPLLSSEKHLAQFILGLRDVLFGFEGPLLPEVAQKTNSTWYREIAEGSTYFLEGAGSRITA